MKRIYIKNNFTLSLLRKKIVGFIRWYLNLINPVRIGKYYVAEYKEHRVAYAGFTVFLLIFTSIRIGSMDFDITQLLLTIPDAAFIGGADLFNDLKINTTTGFMETVAHTIYDFMEPIGISLVVLYWLIGFSKVVAKRDFDVFILFTYFTKLIIPVTFIANGWPILMFIVDLGNGILDLLQPNFAVPNPAPPTKKEKFDLIKLIIHFYPIFFMFAIGLATQVAAKLAVFGRYVKMAVYFGFLPINLSDFVTEEHTHATRALKEAIAFSIQGAVILAINFAAYKIMRSTLDSQFTADIPIVQAMWEGGYNLFTLVTCMGISFTAIGLYTQSETISKSIVGL